MTNCLMPSRLSSSAKQPALRTAADSWGCGVRAEKRTHGVAKWLTGLDDDAGGLLGDNVREFAHVLREGRREEQHLRPLGQLPAKLHKPAISAWIGANASNDAARTF